MAELAPLIPAQRGNPARLQLLSGDWVPACAGTSGKRGRCSRVLRCVFAAMLPAPARRRAGAVLQRQDRDAGRRLFGRRRLRHLCAHAGAPLRPPHPRQSERHRAEHAGRGQHDVGALSRRHRAEGRHRHHHVRSRADHAGADRRQAGGRFRQLPVGRHAAARHPHLLRLGRDRHQDLRRHDEAQGVPDRHHRQGLQRLCERRDPAQRVQGAGAPDLRLSRQQRAAARARARRARRQLRLLDRDAAGLAGQPEDQRAAAVLGDAAGRHAGGRALRARPRADAGAEGRHRHPQLAGRTGAAVHRRQAGAARSGWRSCAPRCRRR